MNLQEWASLAAAAAYRVAESREERQVSRIDEIRAAMRRYEAELLQLERFGDDARFVDGDVIRFTKTHDAGAGTTASYTYAAIKTPAGWYLTGQHRKPQITYDELIAFVIQRPVATDVQVAAGWISIDEVGSEKLTAVLWEPPTFGINRGGIKYDAVPLEEYRATQDTNDILDTSAPTAEQRDYEIK